MTSSVTPSAKNSCSGSPLTLANGSTAIDGLSGSRSDVGSGVASAYRSLATRYTRTRRAIFLSCCSPISSKHKLSLPAASSCTRADTQIPPGLGHAFETNRDIHGIAKDVAVLDHDVANIDANPEVEPFIRRYRRI